MEIKELRIHKAVIFNFPGKSLHACITRFQVLSRSYIDWSWYFRLTTVYSSTAAVLILPIRSTGKNQPMLLLFSGKEHQLVSFIL
jgi:hypothetical protein